MARWLSMAYRAGHEPSSSVWAPSALQMAWGWQALLGHGSFSARKRCGCTASSVGTSAAPSQCHPWCPCGTSVPRPTGGCTERATVFHFHTERARVTHAGLGARRRRSRGGAVGCSRPPCLHPRSHLASVTRSWWQHPRLWPARPGSSLEPEERSMEPPAELEEEVPITTAPSPVGCQLFGYVGIEAVLDQMKIKTMKTGFEFNIMVVGQSGLGKSTMVNTLFKSKVSRKASQPSQEERIPKTVQLQSITHVIEEKGVKMKLTVTDTPGFGDQINNENCWDPIIKYINEQYERYLREEILITRKRKIPDTRVHGCVYFIPPTGHWLRPLDLEFMRRLSKIVNVVPVIAKADTLTLEERAEFKQQIQEDLKTHAISVYPQEDFDQDPDDRVLNDRIRENIPFAVVGADQEHQVNGKRVLGRKTKWGIIEGVRHGAVPVLWWYPEPVGCASCDPSTPCPSALLCSGEPDTLRVPPPAGPADPVPPAGPEGHHPQRPLRELPCAAAEREQPPGAEPPQWAGWQGRGWQRPLSHHLSPRSHPCALPRVRSPPSSASLPWARSSLVPKHRPHWTLHNGKAQPGALSLHHHHPPAGLPTFDVPPLSCAALATGTMGQETDTPQICCWGVGCQHQPGTPGAVSVLWWCHGWLGSRSPPCGHPTCPAR
ncbi:uncharacterized protein LOC133210879 isoform X4 [Neopsephotus bourkii]|uniref:uncharacterized protein LOC133210879 isoform X4 n=1 Tax=Neopsephotus bourkii TaxID=309878 RepID=UPI002AA54071|nr:uncharacterized protein LOC133210879 isoform X4 [Neopsephotus bourkii]